MVLVHADRTILLSPADEKCHLETGDKGTIFYMRDDFFVCQPAAEFEGSWTDIGHCVEYHVGLYALYVFGVYAP